MSISAALSNALSGLTAVSRGTEVVSNNLANNLTPGYGVRELQLSSRNLGGSGGVKIEGVTRLVPAAILADNRIAKANLGNSSTTAAFHLAMETAIGTANQDDSLTSIIANFDNALALAAANPESSSRLKSVADSAEALSNKINHIAMELQKARTIADKSIESDVSRLNSALGEVARLNRLVTIAQAKGQDASSLVDARQAAIDEISDIIPIKELPRDGGMVALFTKGGAALLDGMTPTKISFEASGTVTPNMSLQTGQLSSLSIDGIPITQGQIVLFKGGSLAANFQIRDELTITYQLEIDSFAENLYNRFNSTTTDPSLAPGDAGLFTDLQGPLLASNSLGFSSRISVSNLIKPASGGELWRLRDGLGTTQPGETGNADRLLSLRSALNESQSISSPNGFMQSGSLSQYGSELMSVAASNRLQSQEKEQHDTAYHSTMTSALLAYGVDSDKELEHLLQLEKAYAANARVIQAANDMLDSILRIS